MASIHIHEDAWAMRCLHPAAAWPDVVREMMRAQAASERNADPNGLGWTDIHVIDPPAIGFAAVGLRPQTVGTALAPLLPRVTHFAATATAGFRPGVRDPYGSYDDDAWCYGHDASCFIKLDLAHDVVTGIWFEASTSDASHLRALGDALRAIDCLTPSIIADYWLDAAGAVADEIFMRRYFDALANPDSR